MNTRKTVCLSAIWLFLLVFLHPFPASSAPLDNWHVRNSVPGGYTLYSVTYGNGMFVAVGSQGMILSSPDGTNWTPRTSGTSAGLTGVAHGNGLFVVVGGAGTILTSTDGTSWTTRLSGTSEALWSVAFGNGVFVVLSPLVTLTSQDGVQWTVSTAVANLVKFGDGKFVALSYPALGGFYESTNGITWSFKPLADGYVGYLTDIVLSDGTYVAVGYVSTFEISPLPASETILTSTGGTNWSLTHRSDGLLNGRFFWINEINHGNGHFVAASSAGRVFHSPDGYGWTLTQTAATDWLYGVAYGNRTFVVVGENGLIIQSDPLIEAVEVPTLSEWGIILFVSFCGLAAIRYLQTSNH